LKRKGLVNLMVDFHRKGKEEDGERSLAEIVRRRQQEQKEMILFLAKNYEPRNERQSKVTSKKGGSGQEEKKSSKKAKQREWEGRVKTTVILSGAGQFSGGGGHKRGTGKMGKSAPRRNGGPKPYFKRGKKKAQGESLPLPIRNLIVQLEEKGGYREKCFKNLNNRRGGGKERKHS